MDRDQATQETSGATKTSKAFGLFLVEIASLLTLIIVRSLARVLNFPPAVTDRCERSKNPGFEFVLCLEENNVINPTDISTLTEALEGTGQRDVAHEVTRIFEIRCHGNELPPSAPCFKSNEKSKNFIKELKLTYEYMYNRIQPNPYFRERLQCVNDVFTDSGIEYLHNENEVNSDGLWEKLECYQSVFKDPRLQHTKMFLVYGEPGYGKSTLALQCVYDWCNITPESPLKDIIMLIYLPLRLLRGFSSICMAIKQILLPKDFSLTEEDILDIIRSCESVLFVFDGFDEYSYPDDKSKDDVTAILTRKMFRSKKVFVTTRPPFTPPNLSHDTKTFRLIGFDDKARKDYLLKAVVNQSATSADKILHLLHENPVLSDICQVPLFFVMFAHMTHRKEMSRVFNSVTRFFCYIVSSFYEHTKIKTGAERVIQEDQNELYRIAFESLKRKNQTLVWRKEKLTDRIGENLYNELVKIGIFVEENVLTIADAPGISAADHVQRRTNVRFFHKLFCEWYAAHFVTNYISLAEKNTRQKLTYRTESLLGWRDSVLHKLLEDMDPLHLQYMLRFVCGLNPATADRVIRYFRSIEGGDKFAILCILEQTGQTERIKDIIRQVCSEAVIISGHDSLLFQRSSILLLDMAAKNHIPIACVCLYNCLQLVDLSKAVMRTTSGLLLTSKIPVKKLVVCHYNRKTTIDEYYKILEFSLMCSSLRYLWFDGSAPPQKVSAATVLSTLKERNVTVKYLGLIQSSPKYVLNLLTGRWEREDNGSECTERGFQQMHLDWCIVRASSEGAQKRAVRDIGAFLRKRAIEEQREEEEANAARINDNIITVDEEV